MSRIKNCLTLAAGAAAGLFLAALGSSATAAADTAPATPDPMGVLGQVVANSATIPQQLLAGTTSALAPTAAPAQQPIATATLNMPQTPSALSPATAGPAGLPALTSLPGTLSSVLPFQLPGTAPAAAPAVAAPTVQLIPGLP